MSNFDAFLSSLSNDQKQKLVEALLNKSEPQETKPSPQPSRSSSSSVNVDENFSVRRTDATSNRRKEAVRGRENRWKDEGESRDIETPSFERTPRKREPSKKVDLECHVCGKTFKQDARYVYGEFPRCNKCTGR
jgi:hypothetical protein